MGQPGVIFGGPSSEHDVSILTALPAARTLPDATAIYWSKTGDFFEVDTSLEAKDFLDGAPRRSTPLRLVAGEGFVAKRRSLSLAGLVNCCHGGPGEDGTLQAALDVARIAYTGPSAAGAALGMDKLAFGTVMTAAGLPSLPRALLRPGAKLQFAGPYIVKPRFGGSSIGIEVVEDAATALALLGSSPHLRAGAVVEPYLGNVADLEVAARRYPEVQLSAVARALPAGASSGSAIYGYADKYLGGEGMASAPRELPARLPAKLEARLREMAKAVAEVAGVRGVARVDFLADGEKLYVNEINTVPGSLARYLWVGEHEVPFARLLEDMLAEARERPSHAWTTVGADGSALRAAGSIAGKLG